MTPPPEFARARETFPEHHAIRLDQFLSKLLQ